MLAYYWVQRLLPILLLATAIMLAGGHLKSFFAANSADRSASPGAPTVGTEPRAGGTAAQPPAGVWHRSEVTGRRRGAAGQGDDWVRTRTGWEREGKWPANSVYEPGLHPAVVAALVSLVALWVLVAFPADAVKAADDPDAPDTTFISDS